MSSTRTCSQGGGRRPLVSRPRNASRCPKLWLASYPAYIGRQPRTWVRLLDLAAYSIGKRRSRSVGGQAMGDPEQKPLLVSEFEQRVRNTDEMNEASDTAFLGCQTTSRTDPL